MNIESILYKGIKHVEEVELPHYKTKVRIRPLSRFELNMCIVDALEFIKDPDTQKYFFMSVEEKQKYKDINGKYNRAEFTKASNMLDLYVVLKSVKKFYPNLTEQKVRELLGLKELASKIMEISQRAEKEVDFFRHDAGGKPAKDVSARRKPTVSVETR